MLWIGRDPTVDFHQASMKKSAGIMTIRGDAAPWAGIQVRRARGENVQNLDSRFRGNKKEKVDLESTLSLGL
jgi:hypothetical protein